MRHHCVAAFAAAMCLIFATTATAECTHGTRHEALITELQTEFPDVAQTLQPLCANRAVLSPPSPIKTWGELRNVVFGDENVSRAEELFRTQHASLRNVSAGSGVPGHYILAFLMVETLGGTHLGHYPVIDTLYNEYEYGGSKQRAEALKQLRSYLRTTAWRNTPYVSAYEMPGSSAGAFGLPQFMPYSFEHHRADGDGDGIVNLFTFPDAAASIAKHLTDNGWRRNRMRAIRTYNNHPRYVTIVEEAARRFAKIPAPPKEESRGIPLHDSVLRCLP